MAKIRFMNFMFSIRIPISDGIPDNEFYWQFYLCRFLRAVRYFLHQNLYRESADIGYRLADVRNGRVDEVELYRVVE